MTSYCPIFLSILYRASAQARGGAEGSNIKQIDFDLFKEAIDILHIKSCRELTVEEKHRLDFIIDNWAQIYAERLSQSSIGFDKIE